MLGGSIFLGYLDVAEDRIDWMTSSEGAEDISKGIA